MRACFWAIWKKNSNPPHENSNRMSKQAFMMTLPFKSPSVARVLPVAQLHHSVEFWHHGLAFSPSKQAVMTALPFKSPRAMETSPGRDCATNPFKWNLCASADEASPIRPGLFRCSLFLVSNGPDVGDNYNHVRIVQVVSCVVLIYQRQVGKSPLVLLAS